MTSHAFTIHLDDDDYRAVIRAITEYKQRSIACHGLVVIAQGESDLSGAIVAAILLSWTEGIGKSEGAALRLADVPSPEKSPEDAP